MNKTSAFVLIIVLIIILTIIIYFVKLNDYKGKVKGRYKNGDIFIRISSMENEPAGNLYVSKDRNTKPYMYVPVSQDQSDVLHHINEDFVNIMKGNIILISSVDSSNYFEFDFANKKKLKEYRNNKLITEYECYTSCET